jgi:hypothetical protein
LNAREGRFVRTIKKSCLERMILFGEGSLQKAVHEFVMHYHREHNHQGLGNRLIIEEVALRQQHGGDPVPPAVGWNAELLSSDSLRLRSTPTESSPISRLS